MALHGCEVAAPAEKALEGLSRALARAIGFHSSTTSNLLVFELASPHVLEPASYIMLRRAQLMRRIIAKHPDTKDRTTGVIQAYYRASWVSALDPFRWSPSSYIWG